MKLTRILVTTLWLGLFNTVFSKTYAGTPPQGTYYIITDFGGSTTRHSALEENRTCIDHLLDAYAPMTLEAAVPVYVPGQPGNVRLFLYGKAGTTTELLLEGGLQPFHRKLNFTDVASITPYSNGEVLIAEKNGTLSVVDAYGNTLASYSLSQFFPAGFSEIGEVRRAWRSGAHYFSVVTQNHFIHFHFDLKQRTIIILNETDPKAPNAYLSSFDLGDIFTANGDEEQVWISHDTGAGAPFSFSLFEIKTGKFLVRHSLRAGMGRFIPVPVYHDSAAGRSLFAYWHDLLSLTEKKVDLEDPRQQVSPVSLGTTSGTKLSTLVTPPAQGSPWGSVPLWTAAPYPQRNTNFSTTIITAGPSYHPGVTNSILTPALVTPAGPAPAPLFVAKNIMGIERTRDELMDDLKTRLSKCIDANGLVDSSLLIREFPQLGRELRMELLGLSDSFLNSHGLEYVTTSLRLRNAHASPLSEWVDEIWNRH